MFFLRPATNDLANQEALRVPGWDTWSLRLGYETEHGSVIFFVDNVSDEEYVAGRDRLTGVYVGDPRTFGLQLRARY